MNKQHLELLQGLHNRLCALESTAQRRTPRDMARRAKRTDYSEETVDSLAQRDRVLGDLRERQELQELQEQRKLHEKRLLREKRLHQADQADWQRTQQWMQHYHQHQRQRQPQQTRV